MAVTPSTAGRSAVENELSLNLIDSVTTSSIRAVPDLSIGSSLAFLGVTTKSFLNITGGVAKITVHPKLPEISFSKKIRTEKKVDTAGKGWFDMDAPEITPEIRNDLRVLRNRAYLDPKRHYKRDGKKGMQIPKYFQLGTVIEAPHEFYSARLTNRDRHSSIAQELLADQNVRSYIKKRAGKIVATRPNKKKLKHKSKHKR